MGKVIIDQRFQGLWIEFLNLGNALVELPPHEECQILLIFW